MLLQLNIINFALIEKLNINFEKGFNILLGETGSGKSILIDSINYVLGEKFSKEYIRTGETKTYVEAIFSIENQETKKVLDKFGVEYDDIIILSRESFKYGKTIAKANGRALLMSQIKEVGSTLLDVHGQHKNYELLDAAKHITYLDYFGKEKIDLAKKEYSVYYNKFQSINEKILELAGNESEKEKMLDYIKFQIEEIEKVNLKPNEDKELEEKSLILSNSEKITKTLSKCYTLLYNGNDNNKSVYDTIGTIVRELRSIENNMDKIKNIANNIEEFYYNIEENTEQIRNIIDNITYDEDELEHINSRMYQIGILKKKYGETIQDILNYKNKILMQYDEIVNRNQIIAKLKKSREEVKFDLINKAKQVHNIRESFAKDLELKIKNELNYVGLDKSIFKIKISFNEDDFNENGADQVGFYISTNPGEPLKELERIVSGGELSRIMLCLKTVFIDKDRIPSVIFDEIDTGISGRIAQCVAEKMYSISNKHQVFCVTHLPQIAAMADTYFLVFKKVIDNKTYTFVEKINDEKKEYQLARMIGGSEVTKLTLENANELINIAHDKKQNLTQK